jgi:NADH:ubiquinone oxidoreductase subunit 6 (subunit J)
VSGFTALCEAMSALGLSSSFICLAFYWIFVVVVVVVVVAVVVVEVLVVMNIWPSI